ncbi:hypothetical protein LX32DRAFT_687862 [Colletotrichum zoysiae]|uniref:Uncharacterized protein n=1 Tax=Colletotrichum zoysiae TaxID=1216348 RepID=A0AAD9H393_9PEZI|nr:hypothetical protein LX32DRAFT_687862 [Colletotrichum zoysiae]
MGSKRRRENISDDAILGIDLGSTSTRVCLWCPKRKQEDIDVQNSETPGNVSKGDFPSVGYPFEPEGPVYLGSDFDPNRRPISLKYAFYALAEPDKKDDMLKQYVMATPLTSRRGDQDFRDRLMRGLRELFLVLRKEVDTTCRVQKLKISTVGISIPSQWTTDFEDVYRRIIVDVFEQSRDNIRFHTETEALAHVLLRNHRITLPECGDNMYEVYLFLDFGGHNMNGCIFNVVHGQDHDASFYRIEEPFGAGGGSEEWSYRVGEEFARRFRQQRRRSMRPEEWKAFADQFDNCKSKINPNNFNGPLNMAGWDITLDSAFISRSFEISHKNVLEEAKENIKIVSQIRGVTPYVIVSGGTANHKTVQDRLRSMCKDHGIGEPSFTNKWSISYASGRIARGVAYAAGSRLTFNQFLERGAAFGIQRRQNPTRGNGNPDGEWDSVAELLFNKSVQTALEVSAGSGRDEFKIICDPFFEPGETPNKLHFDHCYDFLLLGKLRRGDWKITFSVTGSQASPSLVLESSFAYSRISKNGKGRAVKTLNVGHYTTNPLPMSFDGGANCYFVDDEHFDSDQFCRPLPTRLTEDVTEAEFETPDDSEGEDHQSGCSDSEFVPVVGEYASSPNEVENRITNNATIAHQQNAGLATEFPTTRSRLVPDENCQAPVAAMGPSIPNAQPNELPRKEVNSPRSRYAKRVEVHGGHPLMTSRRPLDTGQDTRELSTAPVIAGLRRPEKPANYEHTAKVQVTRWVEAACDHPPFHGRSSKDA